MANQNFRVKNGLEVGVGGTILYAKDNGNVAIGTDSNLTANLTVGNIENSSVTDKGATAFKTLASDGGVGESAIYLEEQSGSEGWYIKVNSSGDLQLNDSGVSDRITFQDGGNIGIGTDNPTYKLQVEGDIKLGELGTLWFSDVSNSIEKISSNGSSIDLYSDADIHFYESDTNVRRFTVDVNNGELDLGSNLDTTTAQVHIDHSGNTWFNGGNVGIGTDNPTQNLDINGATRIRGAIYDNNNVVGSAGSVLSSTGSGVEWTSVDADTLDGQQGSYYQPASTALTTSTIFGGDVSGTYNAIVVANDSHSHTFDNLTNKTSGTGNYSTSGNLVSGRGSGGVAMTINDGYGNANLTFNHEAGVPEQNGNAFRIEANTDSTSNATLWFEGKSNVTGGAGINLDNLFTMSETGATCLGNTVWHAGNDGSGSGLDADTLDGIDSGSFLRSDAADVATGPISWTGTLATFDPGGSPGTDTATDVALALERGHRIAGSYDGYIRTLLEWNSSGDIEIGQGGTTLIGGINLLPGSSGVAKVNGNTIWHAGNDGSGSGLDADTLAGISTFSFLRSDIPDTSTAMRIFWTSLTNNEDFSNSPISIRERGLAGAGDGEDRDCPNLNFHWGSRASKSFWMGANGYMNWGEYNSSGVPQVDGTFRAGNLLVSSSSHQVWHAGNDGSGSGLDADTLDGIDSGSFLRSDANDTFTGTLTAGQNGKIAFPDNTTVPDSPTNEQHDYITFGANGSISQVSGRGALMFTSSDDSMVIANGDVGRGFTNSNINVGDESIFLCSDNALYVYTDLQEGWGTQHTLLFDNTGVLSVNGNTVWHAGNDGSGSGLDADTLDGIDSGSFLRSDTSDEFYGGLLGIRSNSVSGAYQGWGVHFSNSAWRHVNDSSWGYAFRNNGNSMTIKVSKEAGTTDSVATFNDYTFSGTSASISIAGDTVWHAGNDGSGSGLDADTLDGIDSGSFLRSDATDSASGQITFTNFRAEAANFSDITNRVPSGFWQDGGSATTGEGWPQTTNTWYHLLSSTHSNTGNYYSMQFAGSFYNSSDIYYRSTANSGTTSWNKLWHAGNDGSGSGLDADTLDGISSGSFLRSDASDTSTGATTWSLNSTASITLNKPATTNYSGITWSEVGDPRWLLYVSNVADGTFSLQTRKNGTNIKQVFGVSQTTGVWNFSQTGATIASNTIWHAGNDGSGSGLDADLLDGENLIDNAATANTVAGRNGSGDIFARLIRQTYADQSTISGGIVFRVNDSTDNYLRVCSDTGAIRTFIGANDASNLTTGTISDARIPDTITPATLVTTKEIRTSNGTEVVINAGESAGKVSGQTGELVYINAEGGLSVNSSSNNWTTPYTLYTANICDTSGNSSFPGNITASGTVTANSDIKLKTNITTITNALDKVCKLRGVEFDYIGTGKHMVGVIAQEVEEVIPEVVMTSKDKDSDDETKSVAYGNLTALLIEAVKEQNQIINTMRQEINDLKSKLGE